MHKYPPMCAVVTVAKVATQACSVVLQKQINDSSPEIETNPP